MKNIILILAFTAITVSGCDEKKVAEIKFCTDIRAHEPCIGEDTLFILGTNIWAQLWLEPGFKGKMVTGSLYGFDEGKRIFIESLDYEISEGQQVIMETLTIAVSGNYEVQFTDSKGMLLDKKRFEVW